MRPIQIIPLIFIGPKRVQVRVQMTPILGHVHPILVGLSKRATSCLLLPLHLLIGPNSRLIIEINTLIHAAYFWLTVHLLQTISWHLRARAYEWLHRGTQGLRVGLRGDGLGGRDVRLLARDFFGS